MFPPPPAFPEVCPASLPPSDPPVPGGKVWEVRVSAEFSRRLSELVFLRVSPNPSPTRLCARGASLQTSSAGGRAGALQPRATSSNAGPGPCHAAQRRGRVAGAGRGGCRRDTKAAGEGARSSSRHGAGFAGLPNLLYLHLESNRIRWLGRGAFAGLAKLRFLDLSGNPQRALRQPAAFAPLRSLHTLLLGSNRLQRLGGAPFRHLPGLATLSLSGNRLLRLEGNALSRLPAGLLEPLRSLQALDLSRNALRALPPLGRLPRLECGIF
uniref:TLR4 interactor with leucine rich repeats n=1 Tax=Crocodylus porosus TaxID=8502 RepID=A0A7M4DWC8_CROPO